jgi:glycosyltransferase involved in cell wall biosynthesis
VRLGLFVRRIVKSGRPDIVFLPGNYYFEVAAVLKTLLRAAPAIVGKLSNAVVRTDEKRLKAAARIRALALKVRFLDRLVLTIDAFAPETRKHLPAIASRIAVIPQPVLDDADDPAPPAEPRSGIVAAGRLQPQKNFALLLRALAMLPEDVHLTILGDGPLRPDLETLRAQLGLKGRANFAGYVQDVSPHFSAARLFVLSSDYEGFGTVVVEAYAAGLPVVATDCSPSMRALISRPSHGRVVPVGDADALAAAIADMLDGASASPEELRSLADPYRLERAAAGYVELFEQLIPC